jgi:tRNA A37 threonylcarbamoyladenosine biosynthesis protein TsaE
LGTNGFFLLFKEVQKSDNIFPLLLKSLKVHDVVVNPATTSIDGPRLWTNLSTKVPELVDIDEPRDALVKMLTLGDDDAASDKRVKIVSVVGSGGLGKTTLAKVVYEKLAVEMNINCKAFVPVSQKPDFKKILRDILLDLDKNRYMSQTNFTILDERQLIKERFLLRCFWGSWRYLRFSLISAVDFYYVINKLVILVSGPH